MDDRLYLTSFKVSGRASIDEFAVRAIATDLDGTLLRSDGTVSPRSVESLRAAEAVGILVVIATARPPRRVVPLIETLGSCGVAVCANGALVYDTSEHRIVASQAFPRGNTREIVRRLREALPALVFGLEQGAVGRLEPDFLSLYPLIGDSEVGLIDEFLDKPTVKILAGYRGDPPTDLARRVRELLHGLAEVTYPLPEKFLLDLMPPGIDKSRTVEALIARHGIRSDQVIAFGDMPNDIELLRWAGLGVAVANAHADVIAVADRVTASNDKDGVAQVVEALLRNRHRERGAS